MPIVRIHWRQLAMRAFVETLRSEYLGVRAAHVHLGLGFELDSGKQKAFQVTICSDMLLYERQHS